LINIYAHSSKGPRATNQDYILHTQIPDRGLLCCVADGVGGNQGGETASRLAVDTFHNHLKDNKLSLNDCIYKAHAEVLEKASTDESLLGMATTLTAVVIDGYTLSGINCGDSRTYILRGNGLKQLSVDHSEVARLLKNGKLSKEEALDYPRKNVLDSAIGTHKPLQVQTFNFTLEPKDRVILMSDGVYSVVTKKDFRDLSKKFTSASKFGDEIISTAERRKTNDNYSIIIIDIN
jgi:serine/threonine protein phosphatase PrpC